MSACDLPLETPVRSTIVPGPSQTWIDSPLQDSKLPMQPFELEFHGASFVGVTEFEVQINGVVIATVPPSSSGSGGSQYGTLFYGKYLWTPPASGIYQIKVRAKGNSQFSSPDQVQVTVNGDKLGFVALTYTPSPTPTAALEKAKECTFTAFVNLFCRIGSGQVYEAIDSFVPNQTASVFGQSTDDFYWYVIGPNFGEECTVPKDSQLGETTGDCNEKPRFTPIPTPVPTKTPIPGCTVRQAGGKIICVAPCPKGASPGEPCEP